MFTAKLSGRYRDFPHSPDYRVFTSLSLILFLKMLVANDQCHFLFTISHFCILWIQNSNKILLG